MDASAAPSIVDTDSSAAMSMRSWLRFEETPLVRVSTVSVDSICSGRSLFEKAKRIRIASEAERGSSGMVPLAAAAGAGAAVAWVSTSTAGVSTAEAGAALSAGAASSAEAGESACARSGAATASSLRARALSRSTFKTST